MFGFFKKKEMDIAAAEAFWSWYVENDGKLIDMLQARDMGIVNLVDSHISPVFPYRKNFEFQMGGLVDGKYELMLFHCGNKYLERDLETLKSMMPAELSDHITLVIEK
ncbi:MAG: hypothetical protein NC184_06880 [Roseburia sp.]|nr:hypothetical protein [Roseburia sp.]